MKKLLTALVSASLVAAPVAASAADRDSGSGYDHIDGRTAGWLLAAVVLAGIIIFLASRSNNNDAHPTSP